MDGMGEIADVGSHQRGDSDEAAAVVSESTLLVQLCYMPHVIHELSYSCFVASQWHCDARKWSEGMSDECEWVAAGNGPAHLKARKQVGCTVRER